MSIYPFVLKNMILPIADLTMGTNIYCYMNQIDRKRKWSVSDIGEWQNEK